jgi:hypothetical protein
MRLPFFLVFAGPVRSRFCRLRPHLASLVVFGAIVETRLSIESMPAAILPATLFCFAAASTRYKPPTQATLGW